MSWWMFMASLHWSVFPHISSFLKQTKLSMHKAITIGFGGVLKLRFSGHHGFDVSEHRPRRPWWINDNGTNVYETVTDGDVSTGEISLSESSLLHLSNVCSTMFSSGTIALYLSRYCYLKPHMEPDLCLSESQKISSEGTNFYWMAQTCAYHLIVEMLRILHFVIDSKARRFWVEIWYI